MQFLPYLVQMMVNHLGDGKPDQSESAYGAKAQLGGRRAGCIKKADPYKETGSTLNSHWLHHRLTTSGK